MLRIIGILIVIGIIFSIGSALLATLPIWGPIVLVIVLFIVACKLFDSEIILALIGVTVFIVILLVIVVSALSSKNNDELDYELNKNCRRLGEMNTEKWKELLPHYAKRMYTTDFETITNGFSQEIEQTYITQNDDWFEPFKMYLINYKGGAGATVTKMLNEVKCPQLEMTHITPDADLIYEWLMKGTEQVSKDVPPLFKKAFIKEINEYIFTPTDYLKHLYNISDTDSKENKSIEMDINDL